MMLIILLIIFFIILYIRPWIDFYKDYRGIQHVILWYDNYKGERKYINLIG